jgi:hypothetical protein
MATDKSRECRRKDRFYPQGSDITDDGKMLECVDGKWESITLVSGI